MLDDRRHLRDLYLLVRDGHPQVRGGGRVGAHTHAPCGKMRHRTAGILAPGQMRARHTGLLAGILLTALAALRLPGRRVRDLRLLRVFASRWRLQLGWSRMRRMREASLRELLAAALEANRQLSDLAERQRAEIPEMGAERAPSRAGCGAGSNFSCPDPYDPRAEAPGRRGVRS